MPSISSANGDYTEAILIPPPPVAQEAVDGLSEIYETLREEDLWAGLWQKRAKYPETLVGIAYEQQGFFEQAQGRSWGVGCKGRVMPGGLE